MYANTPALSCASRKLYKETRQWASPVYRYLGCSLPHYPLTPYTPSHQEAAHSTLHIKCRPRTLLSGGKDGQTDNTHVNPFLLLPPNTTHWATAKQKEVIGSGLCVGFERARSLVLEALHTVSYQKAKSEKMGSQSPGRGNWISFSNKPTVITNKVLKHRNPGAWRGGHIALPYNAWPRPPPSSS